MSNPIINTYKIYILFGVFTLLNVNSNCQLSLVWQGCYGGSSLDYCLDIAPTLDGGSIIVGSTESNNGDVIGNHSNSGSVSYQDLWLVKINQNGDLEWQKCLGGYDNDRGWDIELSSDGGYNIIGNSTSTGEIPNGDVNECQNDFLYVTDAWLIKTDPIGNILWQRCLGGSGSDNGRSLDTTIDGGLIVGCVTDGRGVNGFHWNNDILIVKLNESGEIEWQKCLGGFNYDVCSRIIQTSDGNFLVSGYTNSQDGDVTENHGGNDAWIIKLNSSGEIIWQRCFGGSGDDYSYDVIETTSGDIFFCGETNSTDFDVTSNHGLEDAWVVNIDQNGNLLWQNTIGGSLSDNFNSICEISTGFAAVGETESNDGDVMTNYGYEDMWITTLSNQGDLIETLSLGGSNSDYGDAIYHNTDGSLIVGGGTSSNNGNLEASFYTDLCVVKIGLGINSQETIREGQKISISPVPTDNFLTIINAGSNISAHYRVIDITGNEVMGGIMNSPRKTLNVTNLCPGAYILHVDANTPQNLKFIKE